MRLTLRTLLAYLDDTLDPTEIKAIGQKVAESDAAQELIARLKQVTRRRRLTTPPATGPGAKFDPNTIAEYLDNTLDADGVAEVEKICLESDVHLAEIAACHQILTLVLGEPALVPPTAKQRMYGLVQGREAIPYRKAPAESSSRRRGHDLIEGPPEPEDSVLPGFPFAKGGPWVPILIPVLAVGLLVALGLIIWQATSSHSNRAVAVRPTTIDFHPDVPSATQPSTPPTQPATPPTQPATPQTEHSTPPTQPSTPPTQPATSPTKTVGDASGTATASLFKNTPYLLMQRASDTEPWQRVRPNTKVPPNNLLVSLPGYRSLLQTPNDVELLLWGNLPEFLPMPLLESAVRLHPSPDVDAEFTLERGRVLVTNRKAQGPARVRVHFNEEKPKPKPETWEITLAEPGTEVALDLFGRYPQDIGFRSGEGPRAELFLVVLAGEASVKIGRETLGFMTPSPSPRAWITWDNKGPGASGPTHIDPRILVSWDKAFPAPQPVSQEANDMQVTLDELIKKSGDRIEVLLEESLQSDRRPMRTVAVFCLAALDVIPKVLDVLAEQDERRPDVHNTAIQSLRHWIGRRADQDQKLYDLLVQKGYTSRQAETIMQLLHDFPASQLNQPDTWDSLIHYLKHDKPAIRELAYWHLYRLVPQGRQPPKFNPGFDSTQRKVAFDEWKKLIPDGKLPPPPPRQ